MRKIRPYLAGVKLELLGMFQYTLFYWAHFFTLCVSVIIVYFLWDAIIPNGTGAIHGFNSKSTMIGNMVLITIVSQSLKTKIMRNLSEKVQQGTLAIELIRPVSFLPMQMTRELGEQLVTTITQFIPMLIVVPLILKLPMPTSIVGWTVFFIAVLLGYSVLLMYSLLLAMFVFVSHNWWGLSQFSQFVTSFFSGAIVPITIMPIFLQKIAYALPFQYMFAIPAKIFVQPEPIQNVIPLFGSQLLWIFGMLGLTVFIWNKWIMKNIVVNGG